MKIHGFEVVADAAIPDSSGTRPNLHVVLVDRGPTYRDQRYVTALWVKGDKEWMQGHYITRRKEAYEDYALRINQNMPPDPPRQTTVVPLICCPTFAIHNMAGRPVAHSKGCPNRRP